MQFISVEMMVEKGKDFPILSYPSLPLHVNKGNKSSRMRTIKTEGEMAH